MRKTDYLILGQGIAGSILAFYLLQRGKSVAIIDNGHKSSSSLMAAGMWNPIVFRRMTKSWMVDDLLPEMDNFYRSLEKKLDSKFYYYKNIVRVHPGRDEVNLWMEKSGLPGFQKYLHTEEPTINKEIFIKKNDLGQVNNGGFLDLQEFLSNCRSYFENNAMLEISNMDLHSFDPDEGVFRSQNFESKNLICCEGYKGHENPFFEHIPFAPAKGELITIKANNLNFDEIINAGFFILPLGNKLFKIGATFNWDDNTLQTTEGGKHFLIDKLKSLLHTDYEVVRHEAGIRPTVQDRRPLLGNHQDYKNIYIFNGLGTKGVMLAPYFAKHLTGYLLGENELLGEINVRRFDKYIGQKNVQINHP